MIPRLRAVVAARAPALARRAQARAAGQRQEAVVRQQTRVAEAPAARRGARSASRPRPRPRRQLCLRCADGTNRGSASQDSRPQRSPRCLRVQPPPTPPPAPSRRASCRPRYRAQHPAARPQAPRRAGRPRRVPRRAVRMRLGRRSRPQMPPSERESSCRRGAAHSRKKHGLHAWAPYWTPRRPTHHLSHVAVVCWPWQLQVRRRIRPWWPRSTRRSRG